MATFGPFEIGRTLDSGGGATVFEARKEGDRKGRYAVKVFSLERLVSEEQPESRSQLDPLFQDIGASFTARVSLQQQSAQISPLFAPILAAGHDERGAWYATQFYTRSVQGMLDRFVVLEARDFFHIVESLVKAGLHLKRTAGRAHGNLKPTNIFIDGTGKPRSSRVVVSDPLAGGAPEAAGIEVADLRAIGEVIYQLTLRRKVDFSSGWVILPIESTKEWTETFGKQTPQWLDLCNRLLDPGLASQGYTLEKLEAELPRLKPKASPAVLLVPLAAAVVLALVIGAFFAFHRATGTMLAISTDPPGATVIVTPEGELTGQTNTAPANGRPLKMPLDEGDYSVKVLYGDLEARRIKVGITKDKTTTTNVSLAYGRLVVLSDPPGAEFQLSANSPQLHTPYTNLYFKPGPVVLQLSHADFETATLSNIVPAAHGAIALTARLQRPPPGDVLVAFTSDPPGAEILVDGVSFGTTPLSKAVKEGRHGVIARLAWFADQAATLAARGGTGSQDFQFPHGALNLSSDPPGAQVLIGGRVVGLTPTNLFWPTGQYTLTFRADGYDPGAQQVTVAPGATNQLNPTLAARAGFVEVSSDPPGAEIRDQTDKVLITTVADGPTRLALPPRKPFTLKATYPGLQPVDGKTVQVNPGETKQMDMFHFEYGTLVFLNIQPADLAKTVNIRVAGGRAVQIGELVYLRPNESFAWQMDAPGYQPVVTNVAVGLKQTRQISLALERQTVVVPLFSDPLGARFFAGQGAEIKSGPQGYVMPWGPVEIVARHGKLGALAFSADIKLGVANPIPTFKFSHGTVILTNIPDAVTIREGAEELAPLPGPPRMAYDKPGAHTYDLYWGAQKIDTVTTNVAEGASVVLQSKAAAREQANGIGMVLVKVQDLAGPGKDGWVGKYEVTQREYNAVMGVNPSGHQLGANYPVENVSWSKAVEFCQKLSQSEGANPLLRGQYQLPTRDQWLLFAKDATVKDSVVKTGQPAVVGSKGPNPLGLYDTRGNVWEWLAGSAGANRSYIGGAFDSWLPKSIAFGASEDRAQDDAQPDIGFRVVLIPPG